MEGKDDPIDMQGITPRAFRQIFEEIKLSENKEFLVRASFLEIYNEDIRDLLGKQANNRLELKESVDTGVYVKGLTSFVVKVMCDICVCGLEKAKGTLYHRRQLIIIIINKRNDAN